MGHIVNYDAYSEKDQHSRSMKIVDAWIHELTAPLDKGIPTAYQIWQRAQEYLSIGDKRNAVRCQNLNYLLHNSSIPNTVRMGKEVHFGSGGLGVTLHALCEIGHGVVIGTHVTLGGRGGKKRSGAEGKAAFVPCIRDHAVISTGSKILGGIEIGTLSIIGANSLVVTDIPPLSIVVGSPGKVIKEITLDNCLPYKNTFLALRAVSKFDYIELVRATLTQKQRNSYHNSARSK